MFRIERREVSGRQRIEPLLLMNNPDRGLRIEKMSEFCNECDFRAEDCKGWRSTCLAAGVGRIWHRSPLQRDKQSCGYAAPTGGYDERGGNHCAKRTW